MMSFDFLWINKVIHPSNVKYRGFIFTSVEVINGLIPMVVVYAATILWQLACDSSGLWT